MRPLEFRVFNFHCIWGYRYSRMLVTLAIEDALSEVVARRLIGEYIPWAEIFDVVGSSGIDSVKRQITGMNHRARHVGPVLVLADLDRPQSCAPTLVRDLTGGLPISSRMLIRIAVLEIESWIIADREGMARWLGVASSVVFPNPENLDDPKRAFVQLAARSRNRRLRESIAPKRVLGTNRTGPDYNETVSEFVANHWNPEIARRNSHSLDRAIVRIAELTFP